MKQIYFHKNCEECIKTLEKLLMLVKSGHEIALEVKKDYKANAGLVLSDSFNMYLDEELDEL